jgi:CrcB protein
MVEMQRMWPYLLVGFGGFFGAIARYVVGQKLATPAEAGFPLPTFVINVTGSFLLGIIGSMVAQRLVPYSEPMRLAIGIGFLGAYTTFSTFEFETNVIAQQSGWLPAAVYVGLSVAIGFLALRFGILVSTLWAA